MGKRGKPHRKFTAQFKAAAVARVRDELAQGKSVAGVARALGLDPSVLARWLHEAAAAPVESGTESLEDEVRRLRREVDTLRMERDFAKKAAAYFAREIP